MISVVMPIACRTCDRVVERNLMRGHTLWHLIEHSDLDIIEPHELSEHERARLNDIQARVARLSEAELFGFFRFT